MRTLTLETSMDLVDTVIEADDQPVITVRVHIQFLNRALAGSGGS